MLAACLGYFRRWEIKHRATTPQDVRPPKGIGINGLVIGGDGLETEITALSAYFQSYVIQGADAFVEVAIGFDDYQAAMIRKLKRELTILVMSHNP